MKPNSMIPTAALPTVCMLSLLTTVAVAQSAEVEPNDGWPDATPVEALAPIEGRVDRVRDRDHFRFEVDDATAADGFGIEAETPDGTLTEICLLDAEGDALQCRRNAARLSLSSLGPAPGVYGVRVRAEPEGASYRVEFPPAFLEPDQEREPNDRPVDAAPLDPAAGVVRGRFDGKEDDHFLFDVEGEPRLWRVQANATGRISVNLLDNGGHRVTGLTGDRQVRLDRMLLFPGRHLLNVTGESLDYDLRLVDLGPPPPGAEAEPNHAEGTEGRLVRGRPSSGVIDHARDQDGWRFSVHATERLALRLEPPADSLLRFDLLWDGRSIHRSAHGAEASDFEALLLPGEYRVVIDGRVPSLAEYTLSLEPRPWSEATEDSAVQGRLATSGSRPAAFHASAQRLRIPFRIDTSSVEPIDLSFETRSSHHAWQIEPPAPMTVHAGASIEHELLVVVPPDAWADHPVRLALIGRDATGAVRFEAETRISPDPDAVPVEPSRSDARPDALLGGINVLWAPFGSEWVEHADAGRPPPERSVPWLNDGMITLRDSFILPLDPSGNYAPTYRLPGEAPIELAGVVVHPQGAHPVAMQPGRVRVEVSDDGQDYRPVLGAELTPDPVEQALVFDSPVPARYVRVHLDQPHGGTAVPVREVRIGEFSAIAVPGSRPLGEQRIDLADPHLGGHVVRADPPVHATSWDATLLSADDEQPAARLMAVHQDGINRWQAEWVVGFHHGRAARIDGLAWRDRVVGRAHRAFDRFELAVSTTSPVGPWRRLGEFELPAADDDGARAAEWDLPETWARFVRMRAVAEESAERATRQVIAFPEQLSVYERAAGPEYRSVLGWWGYGRSEAIFEQSHPADPAPARSEGNDRSTAWPLAMGEDVAGHVQLDRREHWYAVDVPAGDNRLELDLVGVNRDAIGVMLFDASGAEVELRPAPAPQREDGSAVRRLAADVEAGAYRLRVHEPPWSLMFVWDNSGSMSSYLPVVYQAVAAYARDVRPNQFANLMPFRHGAPLLDRFTDQPLELLRGLNDYRRNDVSSEAEGTLMDAVRELAPRPGQKGIVLISDAATSREPEVWNALEEVRPRVFTVQVGSTGTLGLIGGSGTLAQDLMQSWAAVNDGFYAYPRNATELSVAYARASAMMRRPKAYRLAASTRAVEPGELRVIGGVAGAAVELVLDASGSMLQRMDGERRIEIARDVVARLVNETLDPRSRFALRAFGHRKPDECFTDRLIDLAPLNPERVIEVVSGIEARNLARTPIGDALRGVADDLRGVDGERLVVLVTDGEETCGGDPGAEIAGLIAEHPETRVHIVGFAIDDEALTGQFRRWAASGRGRYFRADSRIELAQALADALLPTFEVLDANGNPIASGTSGRAELSLPPGQYSIEVATQPLRRIDAVEIRAGERTEVHLDADGEAEP